MFTPSKVLLAGIVNSYALITNIMTESLEMQYVFSYKCFNIDFLCQKVSSRFVLRFCDVNCLCCSSPNTQVSTEKK